MEKFLHAALIVLLSIMPVIKSAAQYKVVIKAYDGQTARFMVNSIDSIIFTQEETVANQLIGKWIDLCGNGYEFVSDCRGFYYENKSGGYDYDAFAYKFTESTGKITFLCGDEYEGALFKDNTIIANENVYSKISGGPYQDNVIGRWTASSGNNLYFYNFAQGTYYDRAKYNRQSFSYTFDTQTGEITLSIDGQKSSAVFNGVDISYRGEIYYSLATFPKHDEVLGQWKNSISGRLYFKTIDYGYYDNGTSYREFNYVFSPETGKVTLYFNNAIETAVYYGDYIIYDSKMYRL